MEQDDDFSTFMAGRWGALYRFAYLLCGDRMLAEDLAQSALIKTYAAWPRIRARAATEQYVRTTITRQYLNERRRRQLSTVPLAQAANAIPARSDTHDDGAVLWEHVRLLPSRQRAVLVLRYYEDLSEAEIAEVMGCARGTVKSQCAKALASLRGNLPADLIN